MPQFQNHLHISDSLPTLELQSSGPVDPHTEFIEVAYAEEELQSLDFDNSSAPHESGRESEFNTLDDDMTSMFDVADAADSIDDIDVLSDIDLSIDDPF